jgi:hypothetical protein
MKCKQGERSHSRRQGRLRLEGSSGFRPIEAGLNKFLERNGHGDSCWTEAPSNYSKPDPLQVGYSKQHDRCTTPGTVGFHISLEVSSISSVLTAPLPPRMFTLPSSIPYSFRNARLVTALLRLLTSNSLLVRFNSSTSSIVPPPFILHRCASNSANKKQSTAAAFDQPH